MKHTAKRAKWALLGLALFLPIKAVAQEDRIRQNFAAQDQNADGAISRAEFHLRYSRRFAAMDINSDRQVSVDELVAYYTRNAITKTLGPLATRRYQTRHNYQDRNQDGQVQRVEYLAFATNVFDHIDKNHDKRLTVEEFTMVGIR